jgi:hypothetical protein
MLTLEIIAFLLVLLEWFENCCFFTIWYGGHDALHWAIDAG